MAEYQGKITHELTRSGTFTLVPFADGYLPTRFTARLSGTDITGEVTLRIRIDRQHGPQVESYTHQAPRGGWIDAEQQHLPLGRLRDAAVQIARLTHH